MAKKGEETAGESPLRISNSFSPGEIQIMEFIVTTLLRGGTVHMVTRHKEWPSLCRKVAAMKQKLEEKKGQPLAPVLAQIGPNGANSRTTSDSEPPEV